MIIFLLFAQLIATPVPHWHCEKGFVQNYPQRVCRPFSPADKTWGFDADRQELMFWQQVEVVPQNGELVITFPPEFIKQPGCEITDKTEEKAGMVFVEISKERLVIKASPVHYIQFDCRGIVAR